LRCIVVQAGIITLSCLQLAGAIESFLRGTKILEELEEKTGYHHLFSDTIQLSAGFFQKCLIKADGFPSD
jgi:hypothetical protein